MTYSDDLLTIPEFLRRKPKRGRPRKNKNQMIYLPSTEEGTRPLTAIRHQILNLACLPNFTTRPFSFIIMAESLGLEPSVP